MQVVTFELDIEVDLPDGVFDATVEGSAWFAWIKDGDDADGNRGDEKFIVDDIHINLIMVFKDTVEPIGIPYEHVHNLDDIYDQIEEHIRSLHG